MANIKSQIKRVKTNKKANKANSSFKSAMRTAIKKVVLACEAGNKELALSLLPHAFSMIDSSVSKHIQHANTAARQKSSLQSKVNAL
ncbi:MAG: 30S ribosomal protein S20 [Bacillales bacterium]|nr:30S ribosomal protein S20 [Bacillales bacterium]